MSMPHMDGWVLEETKKLEAQQRMQQRKLLDLKQVYIHVYQCTMYVVWYVCMYVCEHVYYVCVPVL